ncbi:MAG: aminotransferase class III-fold pyridoxal phosphate-dependent enzyme, partial [Candidatus Methanomethylicaceae archaeon]
PVMGNIGVIPPEKGFLQEIRRACDEVGAILIFDEVITGFRLSKGGAQKIFNIEPDITVLGKIIGGGFPVGAFGGRREYMENIAPAGKVYNAGTFNGNPVTMSAGLTVIRKLEDRVYAELESKTKSLCKGLEEIFEDSKIPTQINRVGSMFTIFLTQSPVRDAESARSARAKDFMKMHRSMLERGVFLPPSQFESCFLSTAHSQEDLDNTLQAFSSSVKNWWMV